ncbi:MAG: hypothetical protein FWD45_03140 [Coriobacteriia bacterium]|nr:hypothetical protein [Coriobacteriia bacterium]
MFEKYAAEFEQIGTYRSGWDASATIPKRNYPITEKQNFKLLLDGGKPMYMPSMSHMTTFAPALVPDNNVRAWVIEANPLPPGSDITGGPDMFGVPWEYVPITMGSMVRPGSPKVPDINRFEDYITFPDLSTWDWEASSEANKDYLTDDRLTRIWVLTGLNERLISMMDFENVMVAYVDDEQKPGVHRFFDRLCDFYDDLIDHYHRYYDAGVLMFNDDWGTQHGPQFSLETAREMLVPYIRRLVESCHKRGMYFELHSCGRNHMLAPAIAEAGVDIWSPQEINDYELLYNLIGDKVLLTMPTGSLSEDPSDEEILAAAEAFVEKYGDTGRVLPVGSSSAPANPKLLEYLYYLSREAFA